ncbi:MAG: IS4 family transposase, partial [Planctomycetia bacterium]|nr:IS4 family transposase [Planctomycetia bacterium]
SLVAYNLVTQFRRQAAALIAEPPRRMSFKRTWTTFHIFLWSSQAKDASGWRAKYRQALLMATQDKLPNRPGRSFAREVYARRPKSNQFQKRRPKNPGPKPDS